MSGKAEYQIISEIKARWRDGESADARAALRNHPALGEHKSAVLALAYEEYCQRTSQGEELDADAYCAQFSGIRSSLYRRLEVHDLFDTDSATLDELLGDAWPEPGDEICGYRLVSELGRGAIGRVFLAEERALANRRVVVKLTKAGCGEAETLSRLKHPHVVPIYSVHQDSLQGFTAVVMPYISRWTLQDLLDAAFTEDRAPARFAEALAALAASFPASEAVALPHARERYVEGIITLGVSLCLALDHTHQRDILHLDIKPSNVLLSPSGEPLLLDFNLSLAGAVRSSLLGGTLPYMSQEQVRKLILYDDDAEVDARSDVYSLGVVLYQLLTGKLPFSGLPWKRGSVQVAKSLLELQQAGPPPAHTLAPRVGTQLSAILARALAWRPADRYPSAAEFAAALQGGLQPWSRLRRLEETNRRGFLALSAAGIFTAASFTVAMFMREPYEERELKRGWKLLEQGQPQAAFDTFHNLVVRNPNLDEAWFGCGRAHQYLGEFTLAYQDFTEAYKRRKDGRYLACAGLCASVQARTSNAITLYENAISEGFQSAELFNNLGKSHHDNRGNNSKALEPLLEATRRTPNFSVAWHNLAIVYNDLGDLRKAAQCVDNALSGDYPVVPMFISKCVFLWRLKGEASHSEIRSTLFSAIKHGITASDCPNFPFFEEVRKELPSEPKVPPQPVFSYVDPLGEMAVNLAQRRKPTP